MPAHNALSRLPLLEMPGDSADNLGRPCRTIADNGFKPDRIERISGMVLRYPVHPMKIWSLAKELTGQEHTEIEASGKLMFEDP